jgi:hypothetical protein
MNKKFIKIIFEIIPITIVISINLILLSETPMEQKQKRIQISKYVASHIWMIYYRDICKEDIYSYKKIKFKKKNGHASFKGEIFNSNGVRIGTWTHTLRNGVQGIFLFFNNEDMEVDIGIYNLSASGHCGEGIKIADCLPKEKRSRVEVIILKM